MSLFLTRRSSCSFPTATESLPFPVPNGCRDLQRIPDLKIDEKLCQEDWGVAIFAERDNKHFWIGLNFWLEGEWLVHFHHDSFAWLQRLSASGKEALTKLITDADAVLKADLAITKITWYEESDLAKAIPKGFNSPA